MFTIITVSWVAWGRMDRRVFYEDVEKLSVEVDYTKKYFR